MPVELTMEASETGGCLVVKLADGVAPGFVTDGVDRVLDRFPIREAPAEHSFDADKVFICVYVCV